MHLNMDKRYLQAYLVNLKNKIIKTPLEPDKTFSDDPLRMIRAIRFSTQLNFEICSKTLQSISKNNQRINIVSSESPSYIITKN